MNSLVNSIDLTRVSSDLKNSLLRLRNIEEGFRDPLNRKKESARKAYFYELRMLAAKINSLGEGQIAFDVSDTRKVLRHLLAIRKMIQEKVGFLGFYYTDREIFSRGKIEKEVFDDISCLLVSKAQRIIELLSVEQSPIFKRRKQGT